MNKTIGYCNTDLDLVSSHDLAALVEALAQGGVRALHGVVPGGDDRFYVVCETDEYHTEPEPNIGAMLDVVESLSPAVRASWDGCSKRDFNLGYDCGDEPWAFNHQLSATLLARVAAAGASLTFTLYPNRDDPEDIVVGTGEA